MKCEMCEKDAENWRYEKKEFCSSKCMGEYVDQNKIKKKKIPIINNIMNAKWISSTHSSKALVLDRWECPICRENKAAECRWNLSPKKRGKIHKCRFCKNKLKLSK